MKKSKLVWYSWAAGSLATFGVIEAIAIKDKEPDTTLSATWWKLRTKAPVRLLIFPPLSWVIYHLFIPIDKRTGGWDDVAVVAGGAGLALVAKYKDRSGR